MKDRYILECFKEYVGIKLHFNDPDYVYSNPKQLARFTIQTLLKRSDKHLFIKLAYKFELDPNGRNQYLISQFIHNKDVWIGDIFDETANKIHNNRIKIINNFDHYLKKDLQLIIDTYSNKKSLDDILNVNYDRPLIYKELKLNLETLALIDYAFPFDLESVNPLWKETVLLIRKYQHFLPVDKYKTFIQLLLNKKLCSTASMTTGTSKEENTLDHLFN